MQRKFLTELLSLYLRARSVFNHFPPRPAKTDLFVILLCLTPDDFNRQGRASGWERVNWAYLAVSFP